MDSHPADILTPQLDLPRMKTGSNRQVQARGCGPECQRAADCPPRTVEDGEDAVASRLDQGPSMLGHELLRYAVVFVEQPAPCLVA